jgi:hypothetical protein
MPSVAADFIDLKSPYMAGHSRRCAQLGVDAAEVLGFGDGEITTLRRAALVHEFGTTAVPNSIWDKPGTLTRAEFDRVELHPMLTEQMLRRSPALAVLNPIAATHHEKADGSGYHKSLRADAIAPGASVLAAVDIYVALTTERADRPAFSDRYAATELRRLASEGVIEHGTTDAVLVAEVTASTAARLAAGPSTPAGSPVVRSRCCASRPKGSQRATSPTGCTSQQRQLTTISSTSTQRSGYRPELQPCSGRCNMASSADGMLPPPSFYCWSWSRRCSSSSLSFRSTA